MNAATCEELEVLYEHPRYDISGIYYSKKQEKLLSASVTGHKGPIRHYFDKDFEAFREELKAYFPDQRVGIADSDKAEERFLIYVGDDRTRGAYYYYLPGQQPKLIAELAPWLPRDEMGRMFPITYHAQDGLLIEGYLTLPKGLTPETARHLPAVVNPHGGPWSRDTWGYDSVAQFLANRGYAVLQMNFRSSTGYGRAFTEAGYKQWGHNVMRDINDPQYPWLGVLIGSSVIGFWYWCTDQYIVQRVLSGKNERESRRGTIFGAYLKLLPVFLFLIPGMVALALHQKSLGAGATFLPLLPDGTPNADAAFPTLVAKILPAGVKGLVVCGILAALMSSLASLFNSSAMLFTIDFWKRLKPQTSEKSLVRIGQMATVVIVILGILWIPIMRSVGNVLYNYLQDVQSVLAPGIAAAFLLGVCWKRASAKGGQWGLLSGIIIGLTRLGAKVYYSNVTDAADNWFKAVFYDFNWLFFCGVMLLVCSLVVIVVSLLTEAPSREKIQGLVFGTSTPEQIAATRASWNKWDVFHTLVIICITVAFYIYFW